MRSRALFATLLSACILLTATPTVAEQIAIRSMTMQRSSTADALVLTFSPGLPAYKITQTGPLEYDLSLASVQAGSVTPPQANSLVTAITLVGSPQGVQVHLRLSAPATIQTLPSASTLTLVVSKSPGTYTSAPLAALPTTSVSSVRVIPLRYAKAAEILSLFNTSPMPAYQNNPTSSILSGSPLNQYGGAGNLNAASLNLDMNDRLGAERASENVAIDRRLNAVIVTGSPDEIARISSIIEAVDVPDAPQTKILIEAKIFEVTDTAAQQLGINYTSNGPTASGTLSIGGSNGLPVGSAAFQAQLYALVAKGNANLLSSPSLQTIDGTEASILTGDALPVVTTITYPGNPPTVQQQLQYVNVGVHLQIKPYVSSGGQVTSVVLAEVSNVTGFIQGNIPQISQRQAISTVRVQDGQPFVIGGLLQDNEINSLSRVPFISDIPILGEFFKYRTASHTKTNLYVMVTPHVQREAP